MWFGLGWSRVAKECLLNGIPFFWVVRFECANQLLVLSNRWEVMSRHADKLSQVPSCPAESVAILNNQ